MTQFPWHSSPVQSFQELFPLNFKTDEHSRFSIILLFFLECFFHVFFDQELYCVISKLWFYIIQMFSVFFLKPYSCRNYVLLIVSMTHLSEVCLERITKNWKKNILKSCSLKQSVSRLIKMANLFSFLLYRNVCETITTFVINFFVRILMKISFFILSNLTVF